MQIITRAEALAQGLTTYFTGKPCKRGGIAPRKVSGSTCLCDACTAHSNEVRRQQRANHPEIVRAAARQYKRESGETHKARRRKEEAGRWARRHAELNATRREQYAQDPTRVLDRNRAWCERTGFRSTERARRWFAQNPGAKRAYHAKRRALKRQSAVALTPAEQLQVRAIYRLRYTISQETGVEYQVHHEIPLSEGGLHHPSNLWVLTTEAHWLRHRRPPALA